MNGTYKARVCPMWALFDACCGPRVNPLEPKRSDSTYEIVLRFNDTPNASPARRLALEAIANGKKQKVRHLLAALIEDQSTSAAVSFVRITRR
jgi:hypothetical protein